MKVMASKDQMSYGGHGGGFSPIQDTGGQQVVIKSGTKIDSIQIGSTKYGGSGGGSPSVIFKLPPNGKFTLLQMCTNAEVVGYIKLICQGITYEAGKASGDGDLSFGDGIEVSFAGISSGTYIDMILFNINL